MSRAGRRRKVTLHDEESGFTHRSSLLSSQGTDNHAFCFVFFQRCQKGILVQQPPPPVRQLLSCCRIRTRQETDSLYIPPPWPPPPPYLSLRVPSLIDRLALFSQSFCSTLLWIKHTEPHSLGGCKWREKKPRNNINKMQRKKKIKQQHKNKHHLPLEPASL